jgi:hypothetical protein
VTLHDPTKVPPTASLPFTPVSPNDTAPAGVQSAGAAIAQVTVPVSGPVVPSDFNSNAVKFVLVPSAIDGVPGVICKVWGIAGVTVNTATGELVTVPIDAVMFVVPTFRAVALPDPSIVAVAGVPEVHVATDDTSSTRVVPPTVEYVPFATYCWVNPAATEAANGVTAMD